MRLIDMRALCLLLLLLQLGSIVPSTIAERNTNWHHTTLPEEITIWIVSVLHESDSAKMGHPADENYGVVVVVDPLTNRVAGFSPFAVALRNFDDLLSPGWRLCRDGPDLRWMEPQALLRGFDVP
uniref:Secreted protein n=1 Tax=Mesocestoides corti TaxID=53468 RepID=A0A5K3G091_MESCO